MLNKEDIKSDFLITLVETDSLNSFEMLIAFTKAKQYLSDMELLELFKMAGYEPQ